MPAEKPSRQERSRRAILDALGAVVLEVGPGFSVQQVADRAGVTHRTVYNHFPTRQDLTDAYGAMQEATAPWSGERPDARMELPDLVAMAPTAFRVFEGDAARIHAYAILQLSSRAPAQVARDRTRRIENALAEQTGIPARAARLATVAIRHLGSAVGWHLLTEHAGLSQADAARTVGWATRVLIEAVQRGDYPGAERPSTKA